MRSTDEIRRLSQLLEHGMDLDEAERETWLAGLGGADLGLVESLREMLTRHRRNDADDLLERGPRLTATEAPGPAAGDVVGPYRLQRPLGRGGMGEVWLAERADGQLARQVALKLPAVGLARAVLVERFARERDILGSLVHPNIARLYDAGLAADGQPWLALEYVEGTSIIEWCDERRLGSAARLRLFRQVLDAVHHAHTRLVLHRDLKPANILVNDAGEVRLLDFGIAKLLDPAGATDDSALTRDSGRPMTLHYASPEQLLGKPLTTACDVYALGVVLYELLSGTRPYEAKGGASSALERLIVEVDPQAPSRRSPGSAAGAPALPRLGDERLSPLLVRDADAMVLKAMAKEPERRYASAEAFDADVGRWLDNRPLEACPPTLGYRVGKFVRRYRGSVLSATLAGLAIVVTAGVAVALGLQARQEARRAVAARDFVFDLFDRSGPPTYKGLAVTAKEILHAAAVQMNDSQAREPKLRAELLGSIVRVHDSMELYDEAEPLHDALIALLRARGEERALASALITAARSAGERRDTARMAALLDEAGPLVARVAGDEPLRIDLALAQGWLALDRGDLAGADARFSDAQARLGTPLPETAALRREAAYGLWAARRSRLDDAQAKALLERSIATTDRPARGSAAFKPMLVMMQAEFEAGHLARVPRFAEAGSICLTQNLPTAGCIAAREVWVETLVRLGDAGRMRFQAQRLLDVLGSATSDIDRAFLVMPLVRYAQATHAGAEYGPARAELVRLAEAGSLAANLQAQVRLTQAEIDVGEGRIADAVRRALSLAEESPQANDGRARLVVRARVLIGVVEALRHDGDQSTRRFAEAEEAAVAAFGAQHPELARVRLNRAVAAYRFGRFAEALAAADRGLPVLVASWGADAPSVRRMQALREAIAAGTAPPCEPVAADFFL